jgi:hypothetical protein
MGHSGGSPHALACGALLPERVLSVVCVAGLAPFHAEGLDWFAGMAGFGAAELRAAAEGRAALEDYLASSEFDPEQFTAADQSALAGEWSCLAALAGQAMEGGMGGMVDDDLPPQRREVRSEEPSLQPPQALSENGGYRSVTSSKAYAITRFSQRITPSTKSNMPLGYRPVNRIANQAMMTTTTRAIHKKTSTM